MSPAATAVSTGKSPLPGVRKAAIFCVTLGRERAAEIMKLLAPSEMEELSRESAVTAAVEPEAGPPVLSQVRGGFQAGEAAGRGGGHVAPGNLQRAVGSQRAQIIPER